MTNKPDALPVVAWEVCGAGISLQMQRPDWAYSEPSTYTVMELVKHSDATEAIAHRDAELAELHDSVGRWKQLAHDKHTLLTDAQYELTALRARLADTEGALVQCHIALTGYLPGHRNNITTAAIEAADKILGFAEPGAAPAPAPSQVAEGVVQVPRELLGRLAGKDSDTPHWDALDNDRVVAARELRALLATSQGEA